MIVNSFISEPIETIPDPNKLYYCSVLTQARNFTYLMKLVLLTKHNKDAFCILSEYIKNNKYEVNTQNSERWTALTLACRNLNTDSTMDTVKLLLDNGANPNNITLQGDLNITIALAHKHYDAVDLLLKRGACLPIYDFSRINIKYVKRFLYYNYVIDPRILLASHGNDLVTDCYNYNVKRIERANKFCTNLLLQPSDVIVRFSE